MGPDVLGLYAVHANVGRTASRQPSGVLMLTSSQSHEGGNDRGQAGGRARDYRPERQEGDSGECWLSWSFGIYPCVPRADSLRHHEIGLSCKVPGMSSSLGGGLKTEWKHLAPGATTQYLMTGDRAHQRRARLDSNEACAAGAVLCSSPARKVETEMVSWHTRHQALRRGAASPGHR